MLLQALRNTDERIAQDKPVTPAFLFAALLWPAYCRELAVLQKRRHRAAVAQQRAADRVTLHQVERIALPRRFSLPMQEIWLLQPRFTQRQRKRVFRLLAHPRFRAAFDFLELRASAFAGARRRRGVLARGAAAVARAAGRAPAGKPARGARRRCGESKATADEPRKRRRRRRRRRRASAPAGGGGE